MANRRSIDNPYGSSPLGPDTSERGLPRYSQELPADTDTEQNGVEPAPTPRQSVPEMTVPDVRESPRDLEEGPIQTVPVSCRHSRTSEKRGSKSLRAGA